MMNRADANGLNRELLRGALIRLQQASKDGARDEIILELQKRKKELMTGGLFPEEDKNISRTIDRVITIISNIKFTDAKTYSAKED